MSTSELISTGILMGIIHVLTGPDHLSALATLCGTNIKSQSQSHSSSEAFFLGIRWGLGHSFGLLIVGGLLIAMEESSGEWIGMDPVLSTVFESFVGIFMLALGAYGLFKAEKNNRESVVQSMEFRHPDGVNIQHHWADSGSDETNSTPERCPAKQRVFHGSVLFKVDDQCIAAVMKDVLGEDDSGRHEDLDLSLKDDEYLKDYMDLMESTAGPSDMSVVTIPMRQLSGLGLGSVGPHSADPVMTEKSSNSSHSMIDASRIAVARYDSLCCGMGQRFFRSSPGILALVAGVIHGVAGPGGVLGVIPAVQLKDARLAALYLGTFCFTSTLVMGGFAAFYGQLSEWLAGGGRGEMGNRVFMVEMGSALLSVCVGFIWLVLLGLGRLDDVFP